ncbi:MAG: cobalamin biosynthesis protein [Candidatus Bathyarchaeia archaeon]
MKITNLPCISISISHFNCDTAFICSEGKKINLFSVLFQLSVKNMEFPLPSFAIMAVALLIDLTLGEPPWRPPITIHPTVVINRFVRKILPIFKSGNPKIERAKGVLLVVFVTSLTIIAAYVLLRAVRVFNFVAYIIVASLILKITFCIRLETEMAYKAVKYVKEKNVEKSRELASFFSRRETKNLNEEQIASAIIESIAENLTDFKMSPLFYYAIFGVPGAIAFKTINILDGTVGFKDKQHINVGWFSAKIDTIVNYIPTRIVALLIVLASAILGEDYRRTWKIALRDHKNVPSRNHGWTMAAMAGALNVRLEKPGHYVINNDSIMPSHLDIIRALRIRNMVTILFIILIVVPLLYLSAGLQFLV